MTWRMSNVEKQRFDVWVQEIADGCNDCRDAQQKHGKRASGTTTLCEDHEHEIIRAVTTKGPKPWRPAPSGEAQAGDAEGMREGRG